MLGEGLIDDINGSGATAKKKIIINISEAKTKFCLSLHYNDDNN